MKKLVSILLFIPILAFGEGSETLKLGTQTHNVLSPTTINWTGTTVDFTGATVTGISAGGLPSDPGANTIVGWDDTENAYVNFTIGAGITYTHATHTLSVSGGTGTVTSFSAGDLSPLFTTSEATVTTTPALTFSLSTAAAHKYFGNNTGSTAAPAYVSIVAADLPDLSGTYQPLDSDLTTISGLTATTDNFLVSVSSAWASRTPAQVRTTLGLVVGTNVQLWDADLDTWATKTPYAGSVVVTTAKTFTASNTLTLTATDGSTLAIGTGGTLGTAAYTASSAYQAADADLTTWAGLTPTTVGQGLVTLANPSAVRYPRINADNTITAASATGTLGNVVQSVSPTIDTPTITNATINQAANGDVMMTGTRATNTAPTGKIMQFWNVGHTVELWTVDVDTGTLSAGTVPDARVTYSDPGYHAIRMYDTTDNSRVDANIGTGLDYVHATHTLSNGHVIGTNVEAWDADLDTWSAITPTTIGAAFATLPNPSAITFPKIGVGNDVTAESAATHRTSIGGTTVGQNLFTATNPSALSYPKISATNTVSFLSPAAVLSDIGAQASDADLTTWAGITPGTGVGTALAVSVGSAGAFVVNGGAGGTPSSLTLTNATGLPIAGLTASTSTALGVGSIELGHATNTTLSQASAGVLQVEGVVVPTISSTNTLTNKRVTPRSNSVASATSWTPNSDAYDIEIQTALAGACTINAPSGTPTEGQDLVLRIKDNGTARALDFVNTANGYRFSSDMIEPTTTVLSKTFYLKFKWNVADSLWDNVAQMNNF